MPTDIHLPPEIGVLHLHIFEEGVFCRKTINIIYEDFDKDNIIIFFEKNGRNMCLTFGLYEFENEMEYWDMPTKLKKYNGEMGFIFDKNINRIDLEMEIDRFIKHNDLNKIDF